jgi:hypothetical protein
VKLANQVDGKAPKEGDEDFLRAEQVNGLPLQYRKEYAEGRKQIGGRICRLIAGANSPIYHFAGLKI